MPTRKDVAKLAGVSESTVSRVFNQNGYISRETMELVLKTAEEIDYRPNPIAISLKKNKTKQILMLLPEHDFNNSYYHRVYKGAMQCALENGYLLAVSTGIKLFEIANRMYDGIIFVNAYFSPEEVRKNIRVPVSVLCTGEKIECPWLENIIINTGAALEMLVKHFNEMGHKRIAFATTAGDLATDDIHTERYKRYKDLFSGLYKDDLSKYIFGSDNMKFSDYANDYYYRGMCAAIQIYESKPDITAIICYNDELALGLMGKLQDLGVKIPGDLSVAGIDDIIQSKYSYPSLTTIRLPAEEAGNECVRRLVEKIEGKKLPNGFDFKLELIRRSSVKHI